ncbi:MAG: YfhO family protein [Chthoniobacterales bacterium]
MKISLRERLLSPGGLAAIFVALFPFVYFFPAISGRLVLAPDDALTFGLPLRVAAAQMLREGHLPLWNPYLFSGMPLFASAQAGVLFPLNWFFLILGPGAAMNLAVLGAYSTAALGAFFYARRTGVNIAGALTTAIIWQCCGFFVAQIGHLNVIHVAALLPWLLWSIDGYGATGERKRGAVIAIFVALQVFAGHPQTLLYSLILAGGYAIFGGLTNPIERRAYLQSLVFIATGLLLGAVQILPTIELLRESIRNAATYDFFTSFSLPPVFLLTFLAPYLVGGGDGTLFKAPYLSEAFYGEYIGYVGVIGFTLALVAPFVRRDRLTTFWSCAALAALALSLGRFWPFDLYRIVYHIPVLNLFRVPARHMMEVDFALAVLAGRAVTFLPQMKRSRAFVALLVAAIFLITWALVTIFRPSEFRLGRIGPVSFLRAPELFLPPVIAAASGWILIRFTRNQRFATIALVSLLLLDLCLWGQFSGWRAGSPRRDHPVFHQPPIAKFLRNEKGLTPGKDRVLTLEKPFGDMTATASFPFNVALQPDIYMMHHIENAAGYDGFGLARYSRLAGDMKVWGAFPDTAKSVLESRALDLLNVRYLIAPARPSAAPQFLPASTKIGDLTFSDKRLSATQNPDDGVAGWIRVKRAGSVDLYENSEALPRVWLASEARAMSDSTKLDVIRSGKFPDGELWDPRRTVLLNTLPNLPAPLLQPNDQHAEIVRYEPNAVEIATAASAASILVLSDNHYPGWKVTVDGKRASLLRADYNLRGVFLEAGSHHIHFLYQPRSVLRGLFVSIFSCIGLALWCWVKRPRRSA